MNSSLDKAKEFIRRMPCWLGYHKVVWYFSKEHACRRLICIHCSEIWDDK